MVTLQAVEDYGITRANNPTWAVVEPILLKDLKFTIFDDWDHFVRDCPKTRKRQEQMQEDTDFQLQHPIICFRDGLVYSAGQRLMYAHNNGFDSISALLSNDRVLHMLVYDMQRSWAKTYFRPENQEMCERNAGNVRRSAKQLIDHVKRNTSRWEP